VATVENSFFQDQIGIAVATSHVSPDPKAPRKTAIVRNSRFADLPGAASTTPPPAAISMNYGASTGDGEARLPVLVYGFNGSADVFRVYYSLGTPAAAPPCTTTREGIAGFVCAGDGSGQQTQR
jgi:hypothetical protein